MKSFVLKEKFPVSPATIYKAWLDSEDHTGMTGGDARCSDVEGEEFMAWDGYITGKNIRLVKDRKIVQHWRTSEFDDSDPDSELIIEISEVEGGCEVMLTHNGIPEGQPDYEQGWIENYFIPMKEYFGT